MDYTFFLAKVREDAYADADLAIQAMTSTLAEITASEAKQAAALVASRKAQAGALTRLHAEVKDALRKRDAVRNEVERLQQAMRTTKEKLEQVERAESDDVEGALKAYELTRKPPTPLPAAQSTPATPSAPPPKPATRPGLLRRLSTRESMVDEVFGEVGL